MPSSQNIAIDGPVASGKTVVGRLVADRLSYRFLDTGNMYRAVTWVALCRKIDPNDQVNVSELANSLDLRLVACESGDRIVADGEDITDNLRTSEVEHNVSFVSRIPGVRSAMVSHQRRIASDGHVVMVGRDIGTVVLRDASVKVFLQASVRVRAKRRYRELVDRGADVTFADILGELERRDRLDTERADSPLMPADDAVQLDTDGLDVESVAEKILTLVDFN